MTKIKDIVTYLDTIAPSTYQESYDNAQLLTGEKNDEVKGILVTLDCTEAVIDEAIQQNCNLIVAHHPIIFKGLKSLTGKNYVERTIIKAIKHDIAIFAIHTNLDHVAHGVNAKIGQQLGIKEQKILAPKKNILVKLVAFVPPTNRQDVLEAVYAAGAGHIGNYDHCSFTVSGTGTFKPGESATPYIGTYHQLETVQEDRIEVILPAHRETAVLDALRNAHPYEEVAHYITRLENENQQVGAGMIGELESPMEPFEFLNYLKSRMALNSIRYTALPDKKITRVAWCGGSGSFLLSKAIANKADAFITADFKYHEFFDADGKIMIADIGHYESEVYTKELLYDILSKKFANFATYLSNVVTNPISYL